MSNSESFWRQSDAWWSQGGEQGEKLQNQARRLRVKDPAATRFFAAFPDSAQWYYNDPKNQKGVIRQGPGLADSLFRLVKSLDVGLAEAYDKHLGELVLYAFEKWPVKSGLSKAMLELSYTSAGGQFVGRINSRAPYTPFIEGHPWKLYRDKGFTTTVAIANDALNKIGGGRGSNRG